MTAEEAYSSWLSSQSVNREEIPVTPRAAFLAGYAARPAATSPPAQDSALREAAEDMRRTAKELRESPNRDCNAVQQAVFWEAKAAQIDAALQAPSTELADAKAERAIKEGR